jgi:hypothetical protein
MAKWRTLQEVGREGTSSQQNVDNQQPCPKKGDTGNDMPCPKKGDTNYNHELRELTNSNELVNSPQAALKSSKKSLMQTFRDRYQEAQGNKKETMRVIGDCWTLVTGTDPDWKYLQKQLNTAGSGWKLIVTLLKMSAIEMVDSYEALLVEMLKPRNSPSNNKPQNYGIDWTKYNADGKYGYLVAKGAQVNDG